jgi:hypothetical protein
MTLSRSEFRKLERKLARSSARPGGHGAKLSDLTQDKGPKLRDLNLLVSNQPAHTPEKKPRS